MNYVKGDTIKLDNPAELLAWWRTMCFQKDIESYSAMKCDIRHIKETIAINSAIDIKKLREEEKQKLINSMRV